MAKSREEEVKKGLPAWMGTYGDMVTLLLCFFVLLFSMSTVDVKKFKEAISSFQNQIDIMPGGVALTDGERINNGVTQMSEIEILVQRALLVEAGDESDEESKETVKEAEEKALKKAKEVAQEVSQQLQQEGMLEDVTVAYSLNFVKITLPGEALFDSARAVIKEEAYPVIDVIGKIINEENFSQYNVLIEGHTDDVPINTVQFPSNWELSSSRAIVIGKYLIEEKGFAEDKIGCTGYGEFRPIVPNDSVDNRAKNRRVEVKIVLQTDEIDVQDYETLTSDEVVPDESLLLEEAETTE